MLGTNGMSPNACLVLEMLLKNFVWWNLIADIAGIDYFILPRYMPKLNMFMPLKWIPIQLKLWSSIWRNTMLKTL